MLEIMHKSNMNIILGTLSIKMHKQINYLIFNLIKIKL